MVSVDAFTQTLIGFIQTYGCLALFVLIVLETAWIIHFAPSEVIIPFARMNLRRFTVYSFGGWAIYNAALVWLVSAGAGERAPIDYVLGPLRQVAGSNPLLLVGLATVGAIGASAWWLRRKRAIRPKRRTRSVGFPLSAAPTV